MRANLRAALTLENSASLLTSSVLDGDATHAQFAFTGGGLMVVVGLLFHEGFSLARNSFG